MTKARSGRSSVTPDTATWRTALTCIEPNKILVRGYPLDEIMGRLTFGEAIYLLLMGEVPSPGIGCGFCSEYGRVSPGGPVQTSTRICRMRLSGSRHV